MRVFRFSLSYQLDRLNVYQQLDHRFGGKANNAEAERKKDDEHAEFSGTRFLAELVHDEQHVQDQAADAKVHRKAFKLLEIHRSTAWPCG